LAASWHSWIEIPLFECFIAYQKQGKIYSTVQNTNEVTEYLQMQ
jgi:hypothetical protein